MFDANPSPTTCRLSPWLTGLCLGLAVTAQAQQLPAMPAGMVTGAYGQSLMQSAGGMTQPAQAAAANLLNAITATAATATDPVSRFLQERGLLTPGDPNSLLNQMRDTASDLVLSSMNFLGVRYTRGGNSAESGFDCSGFTRHIFEMSVGMVLPRRADEQAKLSSLLPIKQEELKPGDLVFFNTMRRTFSHVGIYVGEGKFIHAPRTGSAVRVEDMRDAYWAKRFTGARRADLKNAAEAGSDARNSLPR
jgi:cell wall-associated NlpC family hydrolase